MTETNIFTKHPRDVRMSYLQHTCFALMLARRTLSCVFASLIHAFFPFLFVTYTITTIRELHTIFEERFNSPKEQKQTEHGNTSERA